MTPEESGKTFTRSEAIDHLIKELAPEDVQMWNDDTVFPRYSFNGKERHCLFVNAHARRFVEAGYALGVDVDLEGRGTAIGDFDEDGGLDLMVRNVARQKLVFLHNEASAGTRFLRVELEGTRSNRDAIGAVVRIEAGGLRQMRVKMAGSGFQSQSEGTLQFGLAEARSVRKLTVAWPSGLQQEFHNLPSNRVILLVEGSSRVAARELKGLRRGSPQVARIQSRKERTS